MQKNLTEKDVVDLLRREVAKAGGQSAWARKTGIHRPVVNRIVRGERPVTKQIVEALGLEIIYRRTKK
jgi:DNA-binding transcriptional regulator YdaS (Cro superfamily)